MAAVKRNIHAWRESYRHALLRHLQKGTSASLKPALSLGREAVALGMDMLMLVRVHDRMLGASAVARSSVAPAQRDRRAGAFMARALLPLEASHRAALNANGRLRALRRAMARRNRELNAANRGLLREIERRKAAQASYRDSEQKLVTLLAHSRTLQDQLRFLSRRVLSAQEEERRRISRELHDVIAQMLTGIHFRLAALQSDTTADTRGLCRKIARAQRLVEQSADRVQRFARQLRPAVLDDLGLLPALQAHLSNFLRETGIRVKLTAHAGVEVLSGAKRTALYRVAQEALTNIARHAQAGRAEIQLRKLSRAVELQISDDGKGFDVDGMWNARKSRHLGMLGMRERVEMVGGTLAIESAPGRGTTLRVRVPLGNGGAKP